MYKSIYLKKGKEESLKRFHPWVFSGAIAGFAEKDEIEEGEVVRVLTNEGDFIAVGHYQIGSIAVRVLSLKSTMGFGNPDSLRRLMLDWPLVLLIKMITTPFDWCTAKATTYQDLL